MWRYYRAFSVAEQISRFIIKALFCDSVGVGVCQKYAIKIIIQSIASLSTLKSFKKIISRFYYALTLLVVNIRTAVRTKDIFWVPDRSSWV